MARSDIRKKLLSNPNVPADILEKLYNEFAIEGDLIRFLVADNPNSPASLLKLVWKDGMGDSVLRKKLLNNPSFSKEVFVTSDKRCFIATAAYGSNDAIEVEQFRNYRDNTILNKKGGEFLVNTYYLISPFIAKILERSSFLRLQTRKFLNYLLVYIKTS